MTLEVTPEETPPPVIPQQVEIIQTEDMQLTEAGHVISGVHVQVSVAVHIASEINAVIISLWGEAAPAYWVSLAVRVVTSDLFAVNGMYNHSAGFWLTGCTGVAGCSLQWFQSLADACRTRVEPV